MMDPTTGRRMSPDPLFPASGMNPHVFVRNNPPNLRDPSGLLDEMTIKMEGAGVEGVAGSVWLPLSKDKRVLLGVRAGSLVVSQGRFYLYEDLRKDFTIQRAIFKYFPPGSNIQQQQRLIRQGIEELQNVYDKKREIAMVARALVEMSRNDGDAEILLRAVGATFFGWGKGKPTAGQKAGIVQLAEAFEAAEAVHRQFGKAGLFARLDLGTLKPGDVRLNIVQGRAVIQLPGENMLIPGIGLAGKALENLAPKGIGDFLGAYADALGTAMKVIEGFGESWRQEIVDDILRNKSLLKATGRGKETPLSLDWAESVLGDEK